VTSKEVGTYSQNDVEDLVLWLYHMKSLCFIKIKQTATDTKEKHSERVSLQIYKKNLKLITTKIRKESDNK
jgi:hypothetical protein